MTAVIVEGSPDDFWSRNEEMIRIEEIDKRRNLAPSAGRAAMALNEIIFDLRNEVNDPPFFGDDPYNKFRI